MSTPNYSAPLRSPKGKLYDLNWYVLCKDWYMTDQVPQDHVVIHQNHNGLKKAFTTCTPEKLLSLIDINRGIYEMITRFPHKFYADIDLEPVPEGFNQDEYLAKIVEAFAYFLPDIQFAISGSVSESRASFHLVAQNYVIANEEQRSVCKLIAQKIHQNDDDGVDWKVYTKGRQMKCINQAKPKKTNIQLPITHFDNPKAHLITSFMEGEQMQIPPIEAFSLPKKQQLRRVSQMLAHDDPVMALPNPEGILYDELIEPEHKLTLLSLIPNNKDFSHAHTWSVMNFCICNNIPQEAFLSWLDRKATSNDDRLARREKYTYVHWPRIAAQVAKCKYINDYQFYLSPYQMRRRLKRWYPNIEPVDANFAAFKEYMTLDNVVIHDKIELDVLLKYRDTKFVGLTHPMGTGKTTALIDYLRYMDKSFLYITHRVCVADDIYERMGQNNVEVAHYNKIGRNKDHRKKLLQTAEDTPNVIICINSLEKIIGRDKPFDIVIIDELESTFNGLCQVSTDRQTGKAFFTEDSKRRIIDALSTSVQRAEQVFALDAFLTKRWLNFCGNQGVVIDMPPPLSPPRSLITIDHFEQTVKQIVDTIASGKKVFVSYPFKHQGKNHLGMEGFVHMIRRYINQDPRWTGDGFVQGRDYEFYNADVDKKVKDELGNVNDKWSKYKLIVTNTVLTAGVSYTGQDVDEVYLFVATFSKARDLIQVSCRCRALSTKNIYVNYLPGRPIDTWINDAHKVERDLYTQIMKASEPEFKVETKRALVLFANRAHWNVDDPITEQGKLESFKQIIEDCKAKVGQLEWDNIEEITSTQAQNIERSHLISDDAPAIEKHMLRKFYFKNAFSDEISEDHIKHIWNHGMFHVIKACDDALHDPDSFESIIAKANDWMFFPYIDGVADSKKWKPIVPPEAKAILSKEFILRYQQSSKKTHSLLRKVFNTKYGVEIIRRKKYGNNFCYETPNTDELEDLYKKTEPFLRRSVKLPQECLIPLQDEEE